MHLRTSRLRSYGRVALLALAGLTCRDRSLTGPGLTAPGKLRVAPRIADAPFGPRFTLGDVRVTLTPYPGDGEPVIDRVATFGTGQDQMSLDLVVQLTEASQRFVLRIAATDAQAPHDTIFRSVDTVTVTAGTDAPVPQPVALVYDGKDKDVASLIVAPADTTFRTTDNVQLRVSALRQDGTQVDPAVLRLAFTPGDAANAQISSAGVLSARAPAVGFDNMLVTVGTGNGVTGTIRITGRVPVVAVEVSSAGNVTEPIIGTTLQLTAVVRGPTNVALTNRAVTWGSTNGQRATVSPTGLVSAGPDTGEVFITASSEGVAATPFRLRVRPVPVAAVRIALPTPLPPFEVGDTLTLTATTEAANGQPLAGRAILWSTTTSGTVRVLADGRVIALAPGAAEVVATSEGVAGFAALTVVQPAVARLTLTPDPITVVRGNTAATSAVLVSKRDVVLTGRQVSYRFTRPNVASVDGAGVVTGLLAGDTTSLIAESEGKADTARVVVQARPLASLAVAPPAPALVVGETVTLVATALDAQGQPNADFPVTFTSSNAAVASVDAATGVVTALSAGQAIITASAGGLTATATVTVSLRATGVRISPREQPPLRSRGDRVALTAQAFAGDVPIPDATFTWESRDNGVVSIDGVQGSSATVEAQGNGTTWVVATLGGDPTQKDSVLVVVQQQVAALTVAPGEATRYLGSFLQYTFTALDAREHTIPASVAGPQITWSTGSGGRVVSVDANGLATMVALGTDSVIASVAATGARAAAFVTVASPIRRIAINPPSATVPALGSRVVATATAFDTTDVAMTGVTFGWSSDNQAVLRFDSVGTADQAAYFTAVGVGSANINATAQGQQGTAAVSVAQQLAQIRLEPASGLNLGVGGTGVALATFFDANGFAIQGGQFRPLFSVRNEQPTVPGTTVARVDPASGVVTGAGAGSAEVVATLNGLTSNAVRVEVGGVAISFGTPQIQVGTRSTVQVPVFLTGAPSQQVYVLVNAVTPGLVLLNGGSGSQGAELSFPRGSTTAMLTITGVAPGTTQLIARQAVCPDGCQPDPNPTIAPDTVDLLVASAISIDRPIHVARGDSAFARLLLQDPAPAGGLTVGFSFSTPNVVDVVAARVPATLPPGTPNVVTVPAGLLAVDIYVRGLADGATQITPVPQNTSTPGFAQVAFVSQGQLFLSGANDYQAGDTVFVLGEGQQGNYYAESSVLTSSAPGDSLRVALTSADPRVATTDVASVVVPPGQQYAAFTLRGLARGRTTLTAAAQGTSVWQPATRAVRVTTPYLQLSNYGTPGQPVLVNTFMPYVAVSVTDSLGVQHPRTTPLVVRLRVETVTPAGGAPIAVVDSAQITIRSGPLVYSTYTGVRFTAPGTVRIIADAPGEPGHRPDTATFTVVAGKLSFVNAGITFGQPVSSVDLPVGQVLRALAVSAPQGIGQIPPVTLRRLPNAATGAPFATPASATLTPVGNNSAVDVSGVTGLAIGAERFEASAAGFEPDTVTVNVVRGRLAVDLPDTVMAREQVYYNLRTETDFNMAVPLEVTIANSGGERLFVSGSPLTIAAGRSTASPSYIVGNAPGTYTITYTPENPNYDALVRTIVVVAPKLVGFVNRGGSTVIKADTIGLGQKTSNDGRPTTGVRLANVGAGDVELHVRSLDPQVAVLGVNRQTGAANDTTIGSCTDCGERGELFVVHARSRGTARIELSAEGYESDTIRVVVAGGRFTTTTNDGTDPADEIPGEMLVGERMDLPVYLTDSLALSTPEDFYYRNDTHDADSVTLRLSSSDPNVLQVTQEYVRFPADRADQYLEQVLVAVGPGTATLAIEDSATHADPALARYAPLTKAITVRASALEVTDDEQAIGMRQRFGFVDPNSGTLYGGLRVCRAGSGGTPNALRVRITSSEPRIAAVAPGFEFVTIPANRGCADYDVVGQDSIGVVAIAVQAVDDAGAPIAGMLPDTVRVDVGRPRLTVSAGFQAVPVGQTGTLYVAPTDQNGTPRYLAEPVTVALASSDPSVASIQATVDLPMGTFSQYVQVPFTALAVGQVRFTASDARTTPPAGSAVDRRYAPGTSEPVQVTLPQLVLATPTTLSLGYQQQEGIYYPQIPAPRDVPVVVTVSTSNPEVADVTLRTVTINPGFTAPEESIDLRSLTSGTTPTSVVIRAEAEGYEPAVYTRRIERGQFVAASPNSVPLGDSIRVWVEPVDPNRNVIFPVTAPQTITVDLPPQFYAIADGGTTPTKTLTIPTGGTIIYFWIKATDLGSGTMTLSSPNYVPITVGPFSTAMRWAYVGLGTGASDPANPTSGFHGCGVSSIGRGYCWGDNSSGQFGTGTTTSSLRPVPLSAARTFSTNPRASTGELGSAHTCGVSPNGQAFCSGRGTEGQLGNGGAGSSSTPVDVFGGIAFTYVGGGDGYSCGAATDGTAYCWGQGAPMAATASPNGSTTPQKVTGTGPGGIAFTFLSAGLNSACGITAPGRIYCWGSNSRGQLSNGSAAPENAQLIEVPFQTANGGTTRLNWRTVRVGGEFACAIALAQPQFTPVPAGHLFCWGRNDYGQIGLGTFTDSPQPHQIFQSPYFYTLAAGTSHACATEYPTRQAMYCWGRNNYGQLGRVTSTERNPFGVAVTMGDGFGNGGLPLGGFFPTIDAGAEATCTVAASTATSFAGEAYCWGRNTSGQLGTNRSEASNSIPTRVAEPAIPGASGASAPGPRVVAGR